MTDPQQMRSDLSSNSANINPVDVKYSASRVTKYQACTVDLRPARVVHYPDLNACLINERASSVSPSSSGGSSHHNHNHHGETQGNVDCRAVHFGYAIPVSVLPLEQRPELSELVLDTGPDLTPGATSYLLNHHPQLRAMQAGVKRVSPAQSPTSPSPSGGTSSPTSTVAAPDDDDIAAIAKQISDHAEAIYQTWKSRGLGPSELRNICQPSSAAQTFAPVLTPSPKVRPVEPLTPKPAPGVTPLSPLQAKLVAAKHAKQQHQLQSPTSTPPSPLLNNNNNSAMAPSSPHPPDVTSVGLLNPSQLEYLVSSFVEEDKARVAANRAHKTPVPSLIKSTVQKFDQQASNNVSPPPLVINKVLAPKKATSFSNDFSPDNNVSGLTTWPLKNHARDLPGKVKQQSQQQHIQSPSSPTNDELPLQYSPPVMVSPNSMTSPSPSSPIGSSPNTKYATLPAKKHASSSAFLEEVAREEERLLTALKTGCVVEDLESSSPSSPRTQKRATTPKLSDEKMSGLSRIDYAKIRYQAAQENPLTRQRLENAREIEQRKESLQQINNQQHVGAVSEARTRFEPASTVHSADSWRNTDWVPSKYAVDGTGALTPTSEITPVPIGRSRIKMGRKSRGDLDTVAVPHPELTSQQKQHIKERGTAAAAAAGGLGAPLGLGTNPIRPFLTRGSVAERVLIFEKCPPSEVLNPLLEKRKAPPIITTWRTGNEVQNKTQTYGRDGISAARLSPGQTTPTLRSPVNQHAAIPRFHFPRGRPSVSQEGTSEAVRHAVIALFKDLPGERAARENFADIAKACGLPLYWKFPLFLASGGDPTLASSSVSLQAFLELWTKLCTGGHDDAARMVWVLTRGQRSWLAPEDLAPLVQDVVDTHPGLSFLKEATEFHSRYVQTVIARMFYCANRSWSGRLSIAEIRRSQILAAVRQLEATADINQVTQFFSYEHFYVIYCKFWELDRDHDLYIDRADLARHNDHALSSRMIDRIFSGAVTRGRRIARKGEERMSYAEFVWFLLSEEDKTHPTAIEYWFRCMDLDGDGFLSMYELEYFYEEQLQRMEAIGMETLPFEDCLCQMLDMIRPKVPGKISLRDLKRCKLSPLFFDTFFNLEKYLDHEQRDPFATQPREAAPDGTEMSDWDRYAAEEYELLVAEEGGAEPTDDLMLYDDDPSEEDDEDDADIDILSPNLDRLEELQAERRRGRPQDLDVWGPLTAGAAIPANVNGSKTTNGDSNNTEADEDSGDYAGDSDDYSF